MSKYERFITWLDTYRNVAFDLLRIYLGLGLLVRGVLFLTNPAFYIELVEPAERTWLTSGGLITLVGLVHVVGGLMLAVGLLTRLAALMQIPILTGALFLVHLQGGLFTGRQSFEFSALVLFLLVLVFLYGSGPWSLDQSLARQQAPVEAEAESALQARQAKIAEVHEVGLHPELAEEEDVLVAEQLQTLTRSKQVVQTCPLLKDSCPVLNAEQPRAHPWVSPTRKYSVLGGFYFISGITGPPKEVLFQCRKCGQTIERTRARADLDYYKYH